MMIPTYQAKILRWIAKRVVRQSFVHEYRIQEYYQILAEEARQSFTEDNDTTLDHFLVHRHRKAAEQVLPHTTLDLCLESELWSEPEPVKPSTKLPILLAVGICALGVWGLTSRRNK